MEMDKEVVAHDLRVEFNGETAVEGSKDSSAINRVTLIGPERVALKQIYRKEMYAACRATPTVVCNE